MEVERKILNNLLHVWTVREVIDIVRNDIVVRQVNKKVFREAFRCLLEKPNRSPRDEIVMNTVIGVAFSPRSAHKEITVLASKGESEWVIKFLNCIDDINDFLLYPAPPVKSTPMHIAAAYGLPSVVEYLLRRGADINKLVPDYGHNALHLFSIWESPYDPEGTIQILLQNGCDLECRDEHGRTPFLLAVENGGKKTVELLLKYKANLHTSDNQNQTALHLLFSDPENMDLEMCEMLLELNSNPNVKTNSYNTPLHYIARSKCTNEKVKAASLLFKYGADLNLQSDVGDTALHVAAKNSPDHFEFFIFLLVQRANPGLVNDMLETFLDILKVNNRDTAFRILKFLSFEDISGRFQFPQTLMDSVNSDEEFSKYFKSCRGELQLLMVTKIDPDSSFNLFSFVEFDVKKRASMCRNEKIRSMMSQFDVNNYPIYGKDTVEKFREGLSLYEAQNSCVESLTAVCGGKLNFYLISNAIEMISTEDITSVRDNLLLASRIKKFDLKERFQ